VEPSQRNERNPGRDERGLGIDEVSSASEVAEESCGGEDEGDGRANQSGGGID